MSEKFNYKIGFYLFLLLSIIFLGAILNLSASDRNSGLMPVFYNTEEIPDNTHFFFQNFSHANLSILGDIFPIEINQNLIIFSIRDALMFFGVIILFFYGLIVITKIIISKWQKD